ncbi:hypothetical protein HYH03_010461 [Edaphochlamys debaryana]|uniref:Uncharacterized protein n=1 Tax=Edaphochlamys debaryana TaxID=47281 RepID=A0A835Y569_9CHLO|nr:hypothetical protein HYH03_010461 [Edaphochlamys debaryana]|eukprot:KAG2491254.1 hypothetical protein HYH03_010461 [Edaphochlamys debaryana]
MYAAFLFTVGYTSYFWLATPYDLSESTTYHQEGVALLPFPDRTDPNQQHAPKIGFKVNYRLPNGTRASLVTSDPSFISLTVNNTVNCRSGSALTGVSEQVVFSPNCSFIQGGSERVTGALCLDYAASLAALKDKSLSADLCNTGTTMPGPRIMGNFYSDEFSLFEAAIGINPNFSDSSRIPHSGSIEMFLQFPYTGTNSLIEGTFPSSEEVIYSRKVPMAPPGQRVRWELVLRMRQVEAGNSFWSIPELDENTMDYTVTASEVTYEAVDFTSSAPNNLARIYIKMDDRDTLTLLTPYTSLYSLVGDWGGYLSIILFAGLPAYFLNMHLFRNACKRLLAEDRIEFDDDVRREREALLKHKSTHSIQHSKSLRKRERGHHQLRRHFHLHCRTDAQPLPAAIPAPDVSNPLFAGACPAGGKDGGCHDAKGGVADVDQQYFSSNSTLDERPGRPVIVGEAPAGPEPGAAARAPLPAGPSGLKVVSTADVGSITVKYDHDVFEDSEEDEDDFDDVVRHCTSECTSMYHLRQVVKMVQEEVRVSDLWKSHHGSRQHLHTHEHRAAVAAAAAPTSGGGGGVTGAGAGEVAIHVSGPAT